MPRVTGTYCTRTAVFYRQGSERLQHTTVILFGVTSRVIMVHIEPLYLTVSIRLSRVVVGTLDLISKFRQVLMCVPTCGWLFKKGLFV